jgi:phage terminase small subunit
MRTRGRKSAAELAIEPLRSISAYDRPATSRDRQPPPEHLTPLTKAWWLGVTADYALEPHQLRTLQAAAEAWDRYQQARESIAQHGLTYVDGKGMIRSRPEVQIERDARVAFLRAMRELNLAVEPPAGAGLQPAVLFRR